MMAVGMGLNRLKGPVCFELGLVKLKYGLFGHEHILLSQSMTWY